MTVTEDKTTAAACSREHCEGCEIEGQLLCLHTPKDLMDFAVLFISWFIPFLAGMVIGKFWIGLVVWGALAAIFFGYLEAFILCRHCPHYAESGFLLRCHANWGLPKIPRFDPRPLRFWEKSLWILYVAVLFLYNVPFFIVSQQWLMLTITTSTLITAAWTVRRTMCNRCYHLSCPVNVVPDDVREAFFRHYSVFDEAWQGKEDA